MPKALTEVSNIAESPRAAATNLTKIVPLGIWGPGGSQSPILQLNSWHPDNSTTKPIDEVFGWFDNNNIEILNVSPPVLGSSTEDSPNLFEKSDLGSPLKRWTTQISWLSSIAREGAMFDVIGRKRI